MTSSGILGVASVFAPLIGQVAWQVRADEHGCVMMEFGAPHLEIREPKQARAGSSAKVQRLLARRTVAVLGDWHLWIESGYWTLKTRNGATSSGRRTKDLWQAWMDDVAGQKITHADSDASGALTLRFDMGAVLEVRPDNAHARGCWSLHPWQGAVVSCDADGHISSAP